MSQHGPAALRPAAFFDVDGTLVDGTIVHYYVYFRRRRMSPTWGTVWYLLYLVKCIYYIFLDRVDRSRFNVCFYRSYAGLPAAEIKALALDCYRNVIQPRRFAAGKACLAEHRAAGDKLVLVTGSLDFVIRPLADDLAADGMVASSLMEQDGVFTGELTGPPIGAAEKAHRVRQFAEDHDIDLSRSHAYGDSIADLPLLELVAHPHAVNPDRGLSAVAKSRGWPVHSWEISPAGAGTGG